MNLHTTSEAASPEEPQQRRRRPVVAFVLAVLAVGGIGAAATSAAWTDNVFFSADANAASFNLQGSVDGGKSWVESDNKGDIQLVVPKSALSNLLPGETRTVDLQVKNLGTVGAALTWNAEWAATPASTFTRNPDVTIPDLASALTAASGATATDSFTLQVTTPSDWDPANQGKSGVIIITIEGTATA